MECKTARAVGTEFEEEPAVDRKEGSSHLGYRIRAVYRQLALHCLARMMQLLVRDPQLLARDVRNMADRRG